MQHPDVKKRLGEAGIAVIVSQSSAEFAEFIKGETSRFETLVREIGITAD